MKARDGIKAEGTKMYFAYSGVLDREAFEEWREEHSYQFFHLPAGDVVELKGHDLIFDFPSRWWGGRVAGLVEKQGASVFGRVFEIPLVDWPVVQHKEGVITGMSVEKTIQLELNGKQITAVAFVTNPARANTTGPISDRFVAALVRGASSAGLPAAYVQAIPAKAI